MALSSCTELAPAERAQLLRIARGTVYEALGLNRPPRPRLAALPPALLLRRGVFVTLTSGGRLRGCIGTLEAQAPLGAAVADATHGAAFRDPRFPPLQVEELDAVHIEISVLSPLEPLPADNRQALLNVLRPGRDGLLLRDGQRQATFLPHVWEQLPAPDTFLDHLLAKAGLPVGGWSPGMRCFRYQAECFGESGTATNG
ncbi:MAG: AmmeMemoRadiSam system protein A [Halioglobus sp.]